MPFILSKLYHSTDARSIQIHDWKSESIGTSHLLSLNADFIRIELPTTINELRLIESAATSGITYPATANGIVMEL